MTVDLEVVEKALQEYKKVSLTERSWAGDGSMDGRVRSSWVLLDFK
jgi:hypothetical protein